MIKTVATNRYEKELKLMIKRGKDLNKLDHLLEILEANINKKIEDSNNTIENNNSIKNKYVNVAEASYNILLRKDNFPQYFYLEICNRLGVRINEREHFIRDFEGERYGIQNGVLKKEFITEDAKEAAMIHQKSNQSRQQKRYVPPCFRQEVQEVLTQENKEDQDINQDKDDSEQVESFPQLTNTNVVNIKHSVWNNKPNIKSEIIKSRKRNKQLFRFNLVKKYIFKFINFLFIIL